MFFETRKEHGYLRKPPTLVCCSSSDPEMMAFFFQQISEREASCPAEGVSLLSDVWVYGARHVLLPTGQWLSESVADFADAAALLDLVTPRIRESGEISRESRGRKDVIIAKAGAENYGHVIVEILPKIINIGLWRPGPVNLIVPSSMQKYAEIIKSLCESMSLDFQVTFLSASDLFFQKKIYYATPVSLHNKRKSGTLLTMVEKLLVRYGSRIAPTRRIYVTRPGGDKRRVANEDDVKCLVARYGYEILNPLSLSLEEQIAAFSEATHVVGPLGAGLTNVVWADKATKVMIFDPGLADFFFWDLCSAKGQDFYWYFCGEIQRYSERLSSSPFSVNMDFLVAALNMFHQRSA